MAEKVCASCNISKPLDEFYLRVAGGGDGDTRHSYCIDCQKTNFKSVKVKAETREQIDEILTLTGGGSIVDLMARLVDEELALLQIIENQNEAA
jgi:hypothetical protein